MEVAEPHEVVLHKVVPCPKVGVTSTMPNSNPVREMYTPEDTPEFTPGATREDITGAS
jgi:hypothetical protein